ncbi:MAG: fasciclin domain-containing protein [Phycisphaerales bacterium]
MHHRITCAIGLSALLAGVAAASGQCGDKQSSQSACGNNGGAGIAHVALVTERDAPTIVEVAQKAGTFKTLTAALTAAGLADALSGEGPFTVFAPTDEAFAKLPKGTVEDLLKPENKATLVAILKYHVVKGAVKAEKVVGMPNAATLGGQRVDISVNEGVVSIDKSKVTKTDIEASNGVIHVIDRVLMPETKNIVDTAVAAKFTTLVSLVKAAGLADALSGEGPFTVFAPTDEAFAKLPKETLAMLGKPENKDTLAAILKYHVVSGRVYADDAMKLHEAKTLNGQALSLKKNGKSLMVDSATVTKTDIETSNGVIHVIDSVIMPK